LALPLYLIYSNSVSSNVFPSAWKDANITPIFKSGSPHLANNYRPVSLLSILSKILERFVFKDLITQCTQSHVLHTSQHGFLPGRSCITNLLDTYDQISSLVDKGVPCDLLFLDFSKAFDSISHTILLEKLTSFGFRNSSISWIQSYLCARRQRVKLRGTSAPWVSIFTGVPQGSVLGPLLFNIYMSDLPPMLSAQNNSYADDFKLFAPALDNSLQDSLDQVYYWANQNHLSLNPDKCTVLHFGHSNPHFTYLLSGQPLHVSSSHRDLGVVVDHNLKFNLQADSAIKKAFSKAHYILKKFTHLDSYLFSLLYKTFIRPTLEYCSQICRPVYITNLNKLEKCQRKLTKWCPSLRHLPYDERLRRLQLPTLRERFDRGDAILTYQLLSGILDVDASRYLCRNYSQTRGHSLKLQGSTSRLNTRKYFFSERVITPWNSLTEYIVTAPSLNSFKARLDVLRL
jgi:hypothetical protein